MASWLKDANYPGHPTPGLCLGPYGGPMGGAVSYERGTPVGTQAHVEADYSQVDILGFRYKPVNLKLISQEVFTQSSCKGRYPHKSVNLSCIIDDANNKLTVCAERALCKTTS